MEERIQGSCLCGAVVFAATLPLRGVIACHCSQCRKTSGHYWAASAAPLERFVLIESRGLRWYRASPLAERGFCGGCGATLFWKPTGEARISFAAGALDGATGLAIESHWHGEDAGDYYSPEGPPPMPSTPAAELQGGCLCGENRFALPGPMGEVWACHCSQCRKTSGHYAASFQVDPATIRWSRQHLASHVAPGGGERQFCPTCGASLMFRKGDEVSLEAGVLDNPTGGHLARHIFTRDKGDYYTLDDGVPQQPGA